MRLRTGRRTSKVKTSESQGIRGTNLERRRKLRSGLSSGYDLDDDDAEVGDDTKCTTVQSIVWLQTHMFILFVVFCVASLLFDSHMCSLFFEIGVQTHLHLGSCFAPETCIMCSGWVSSFHFDPVSSWAHKETLWCRNSSHIILFGCNEIVQYLDHGSHSYGYKLEYLGYCCINCCLYGFGSIVCGIYIYIVRERDRRMKERESEVLLLLDGA